MVYESKNLSKGIKAEKGDNHTKNPYFQKKIAQDHLKQNKDYYKFTGKGKEFLVSENKKNMYCKSKTLIY